MLRCPGFLAEGDGRGYAESFVCSVKTGLIRDRVWRSQFELAIVEYVAWLNDERFHPSLGNIPPVEYEQQHATR